MRFDPVPAARTLADAWCSGRQLREVPVDVGGRERATAASGENMTDPLTALGDLIAIAWQRGMTLPAGSIVSTGSASLPFVMTESTADVAAFFLGQELRFRTRVADFQS